MVVAGCGYSPARPMRSVDGDDDDSVLLGWVRGGAAAEREPRIVRGAELPTTFPHYCPCSSLPPFHGVTGNTVL